MMNKKILITGARGFSGQHACTHFHQRNYQVFPLARGNFKDSSTDLIYCDLTKLPDVKQVIQTVMPDYILHLAGKNHAGESWEQPELYMEGNIRGTINLLEAVRKYKHDTKVLIAGSMLETSLANEKPNHPYGLSKSIQSTVALAWYYLYQLPILVVRPPNLIGPGNSTGVCSQFAKKIAISEKEMNQKAVLTIHTSHVKRAFLDVRDAVSIYTHLLEHGEVGKVYELKDLETYTLNDIVSQFESLTSCTIEKNYIGLPEPINSQPVDREPVLLGEKIVTIPCRQGYHLKQSLMDILTYFREANQV